MTQEVAWNDGTGDKIYLTYAASAGNQTIAVSSDAHGGYVERTKTLTFTASGVSPVTLTVNQSGKNITVITRNDVAKTYSDVALGYEQ